MKRFVIVCSGLLFLCIGYSQTVTAQENLIETSDTGLTDWESGFIEVTGQGTARYMGNRVQEELMAKKAARMTAQARLLEQTQGLRLTGLSTLGAEAQSDTRAATRIKGTLKGAQTVRETIDWHKDKTSRRGEVPLAEVTLRLCINAACQESKTDISHVIQPQTVHSSTQDYTGTGYSALIIDLQQALYLPALVPEVIDEQARVIYSSEKITGDLGPVQYAKTLQKAKALPIAGSNPLVVQS